MKPVAVTGARNERLPKTHRCGPRSTLRSPRKSQRWRRPKRIRRLAWTQRFVQPMRVGRDRAELLLRDLYAFSVRQLKPAYLGNTVGSAWISRVYEVDPLSCPMWWPDEGCGIPRTAVDALIRTLKNENRWNDEACSWRCRLCPRAKSTIATGWRWAEFFDPTGKQ
jgi:hypothetical protein